MFFWKKYIYIYQLFKMNLRFRQSHQIKNPSLVITMGFFFMSPKKIATPLFHTPVADQGGMHVGLLSSFLAALPSPASSQILFQRSSLYGKIQNINP